MGDFALEWANGSADLVKVNDDLKSDEGLLTAVILSLFCDRKAEDDDDLPSEDGNRRGWWGDEFAEKQGDRIGSRRWLLSRSKRIEDTLLDAKEFDEEALAWFIEDHVASRVDVETLFQNGMLVELVTIWRPGKKDPTRFRFAHVWEGQADAV